MNFIKDTGAMMKGEGRIRWVRLALIFLALVAVSFGLAYLLNRLVARFEFLQSLDWLACLIVFGVSLASNLTILAPVPFQVSIMISAATNFNPVLIALSAAVGGVIGELSGYYAGYLGRKVAISESVIGFKRVQGWMQRYGIWTITLLAFQPIIPFDIGGLVAGAAKLPLHKFLPALFLGKFPKYLILTYGGIGVLHYIPFLSP